MRKELIDQTAHIGFAFLCFVVFSLESIAFGFVAGVMIGMIREVTEEGERVSISDINNAAKSYKDLFFWGVGGLLAKIFIIMII